jgi:PmbA protein
MNGPHGTWKRPFGGSVAPGTIAARAGDPDLAGVAGGAPQETLDAALSALRAEGAEGDAFLENRRTLDLRVRDGKQDSITRSELRGLAVRAMMNGRLGFCHTGKATPSGAAEAARQACELARAASPRDDLVLAGPAGPGDGSDEGLAMRRCDETLDAMSITEKVEYISDAEAAGRGFDARIKRSEGASWNEGLSVNWIANTRGLFRHYRASFLSTNLGVIAEDNGEMQSGEVGWEGVRRSDLPGPDSLGRRAGDRAVRLLGGAPVATGRFPVVFSPESGWALLVYLTSALNGSSLAQRRSWLAPLMEGGAQPVIGSPLVTVRDDGRLAQGPARFPFDGEGVDTRENLLLDRGRVTGVMCDLASAKRLGRASTGNATRGGYEALPQIGSHNLYLAPGPATVEQVLAGVERGLWVWGLTGWWIGLDPSNDQFSSAAFGLWIENGKPVRPVSRVTIAGRLPEILGAVDMVANDLVWEQSTRTPTFRVKEMALAGT